MNGRRYRFLVIACTFHIVIASASSSGESSPTPIANWVVPDGIESKLRESLIEGHKNRTIPTVAEVGFDAHPDAELLMIALTDSELKKNKLHHKYLAGQTLGLVSKNAVDDVALWCQRHLPGYKRTDTDGRITFTRMSPSTSQTTNEVAQVVPRVLIKPNILDRLAPGYRTFIEIHYVPNSQK